MLYFLSLLKDYYSPLNIFSYITFRMGGAILTALAATLLFAPWFIEWVKKLQVTQTIRTDGPQTHQKKSGTPTMGGLLMLGVIFLTTLLWCRIDNRFVILSWLTLFSLGFLGFYDDYLKRKMKNPKGMTPAWKISGQMILAVLIAGYLYLEPPNVNFVTSINVPYVKNLYLSLGVGYIFLSILIVVGSSNAVNLTDGLDGLAVGAIVMSALTYAVFAYLAGHANLSSYLRIIPVQGAGEMAIFLAAVVGAGLGFLWYNSHPAEIFMGDTGSLFLGGLLGLTALIIKQELLLIVVGGVFVAEALSVLMQVYSFRMHRRRIFKMAPLHHHFELSGWKESKVVVRFWIISIILSLIALAALKLR